MYLRHFCTWLLLYLEGPLYLTKCKLVDIIVYGLLKASTVHKFKKNRIHKK